ncbi:hypothetical protein L7F22_063343 [Adiantum nelumboides]|nr:hypothetical protein [Adiantum nelumboides]
MATSSSKKNDKMWASILGCRGLDSRTASCDATAFIIIFGNEQLTMDLVTNKLLFEVFLHSCKKLQQKIVFYLCRCNFEKGFSVAFDPLDGSSLVVTNFVVDTIVGSEGEGNLHKYVISKYKGKAALSFEVAPMGLLIEKPSGYNGDGNQSVLDKVIVGTHDLTQVAYGSKNEIICFEETLLICLPSRPWS